MSDLAPSALPAKEEPLVCVEGVSKKFCRSLKKSLWYGLCDIAAELNPFSSQSRMSITAHNQTQGNLRNGEFWAVNEVGFELRRGECLGLIGHNGAGKTTLLKMLNGLIKPDSGRILMRGRVGALIALGAGFNPILTGRENIYINGAVLGLSKREIDEKIDAIVEFAEIGDFIDMPVQNYSSGMSVRLGFAVASSLNPDVLILDEVLAVGDMGFVYKCLNRVRELSANAAVILVSHQMQMISSFCTRVMLMEHGRMLMDVAPPAEGIDRYYKIMRQERVDVGTLEASIRAISLSHGDRIKQGECVDLRISFHVSESSPFSNLLIYIMNESMTPIICFPVVNDSGSARDFESGFHEINAALGALDLAAGKYSVSVTITNKETQRTLLCSHGLLEFRVFAERTDWGRIVRPVVARK